MVTTGSIRKNSTTPIYIWHIHLRTNDIIGVAMDLNNNKIIFSVKMEHISNTVSGYQGNPSYRNKMDLAYNMQIHQDGFYFALVLVTLG